MFSFLRPYIFSLDPEAAHELAIKSLKFNFIPENFFKVEDEEMLETVFFNRKLSLLLALKCCVEWNSSFF